MPRIAVVALGGNAFTREGETGTYAEQTRHAAEMAHAVWALHKARWSVVLVHGNGPQIGDLAIQQEEGAALVAPQPLFSLGAMTQGELGSLIAMALHNAAPEQIPVVAMITHVLVSLDDPAFDRPTKPIGPFFTEAEATRLARKRGWTIAEDSGRGYRRVVPSPEPRGIVEEGPLRALVDQGIIVVAAGGGGVPVVDGEQGYRGVDAVVDKDYAAQTLATSLGAEALVLVTGVPHVVLDFGKPGQRNIDEITVDEAEAYLAAGQFPEGSMGPKVRSAIRFLRGGGRTVVITTPEHAAGSLADVAGLDGRGGTRIVSGISTAEGVGA
jgi:carbamate kinase